METTGEYFDLTQEEKAALALLAKHGYAFPAKTKIGVLRLMLKNAWDEKFPGKELGKLEDTNE